MGSWFSIDSFRIYFDVTPDLLVRRYVFRARARNLNELFQNRSWRSCTNAVTLNYRKGAVADGENSDLYGAFLCALTFSSLLLLGIKMSTTPWHVRVLFPTVPLPHAIFEHDGFQSDTTRIGHCLTVAFGYWALGALIYHGLTAALDARSSFVQALSLTVHVCAHAYVHVLSVRSSDRR